ncbi:MAG TPA: recombination protein NinG [Verrucomicrobiae bacterium]|nr:recombination protein NinG [Verrucomicrobiae bacterium]
MKEGKCLDCDYNGPLIAGRCQSHYKRHRAAVNKKKPETIEVRSIQKYNNRSISWLIKKATQVFNKYIRERDSNGDSFTCISCGELKSLKQIQAGHYLSAGHNGVVRFNEDNVHAQCIRCNTYLSGNQLKYRENLIKKIGSERLELLERIAKQSGHRWDRFGLIHLIETYKQKIKDYDIR